jgi:hypothetical protein
MKKSALKALLKVPAPPTAPTLPRVQVSDSLTQLNFDRYKAFRAGLEPSEGGHYARCCRPPPTQAGLPCSRLRATLSEP